MESPTVDGIEHTLLCYSPTALLSCYSPTAGSVLVKRGVTLYEIFAAKPLFKSKTTRWDALGRITVRIISGFKHSPAMDIVISDRVTIKGTYYSPTHSPQ